MGVAIMLLEEESGSATGSIDCEPSARTRWTSAAATPLPLALAEKRPGAVWETVIVPVAVDPSGRVSLTVAVPSAVPAGINIFTCPGDTKYNGAGRAVPWASITETEIPPRVLG